MELIIGKPISSMVNRETKDAPLKWAHDVKTGEPRYIHDQVVIDSSCRCSCPSCNLELIPVLPNKPFNNRPSPHFRHPPGAQRDGCAVIAARLAVTRFLQEYGVIELPRRGMSRSAIGFSGEEYEVWVEAPPETVVISGAKLYDFAKALLTLDDGRELIVDLTGQTELQSDGSSRAVISISLSDPAIAILSLEEIRARLKILPDMHWCSHWSDNSLSARANELVQENLKERLDGWDESEEREFLKGLPPDLDNGVLQRYRRETLLHYEVKKIISNATSLKLPMLEIHVRRDPPIEFGGDWDQPVIRKIWLRGSSTIRITNAVLEKRVGEIIPDIVVSIDRRNVVTLGSTTTMVDDDFESEIEDLLAHPWPPTLLVEVTVTHGIDERKLQRIQELGMPALEINIGSLGGHVTYEGLRDLVVNQTIGKNWIYHPLYDVKFKRLEDEIDNHPISLDFKDRLFELRRPSRLATPVRKWAEDYLSAVRDFHDANLAIKKARKQTNEKSKKPPFLRKDSEHWKAIINASEALETHGLFGASEMELLDSSGVIARLLSLQLNRGVGYDVSTGFQVLNAIMQSGGENQQWNTLYLMAAKSYGLTTGFTEKQAHLFSVWRKSVIDKISQGDQSAMRPARYDPLFSVLFPELAPAISKGYGNTN